MTARSDSRRVLRWLLTGLLGLGLLWASPSAIASPAGSTHGPSAAHRAELSRQLVVAALDGVDRTAVPATAKVTVHHLRSLDAAAPSDSPTSDRRPAMSSHAVPGTQPERRCLHASPSRAPPVAGTA